MELYHVIYRGVDGRKIFADDQDRARFVHDLYEFNDRAPAPEFMRRLPLDMGHGMSHIEERREKIVALHGWKLMTNHVHLLLSERVEDGLSLFMRKMRGYARYFNERHERRGMLLERTKKVHIEHQEHFLYVLHYVHLNGLDGFPGMRNWRERDKGTIRDVNIAIRHLQEDKWSSFRDYCRIHNFPSILTKSAFESYPGEYEKDVRAFLKDRAPEDFDQHVFE